MRRFAMALDSRVCELHQQLNSPIYLTITFWDPLSNCFSPPAHHPLPLPVDVELLVASVVHNFELGESQIHAVLRKRSVLMIGCVDVDTFKYEVLVEVDLPHHKQQKNSYWADEGCWLVDGPTFVAQGGDKKLVIVHSSVCETSLCLDNSAETVHYIDDCWHTYLLNLEGVGDIKGVRTLYCGELTSFEGSNLLLALQFSSAAEFQAAAPSCSFRAGWNFVSISVDQFSRENSKIFGSSNLVWQSVPLENGLRACNDMFPSDASLDLISCVGVIPRDPVTALSFFMSSVPEDVDGRVPMHDVVIGYWNGKVAKYRMGALIAEIDLEDSPVSLQFAVVAEGQGIILCVLNGDDSTVVALCAETLLLLKDWPKCEYVVVGDFQQKGHDQLLLLLRSSEPKALQTIICDDYLIPQQLTDLNLCYFSIMQDPALPDLSSRKEASETYRTERVDAIKQCLKTRMEAGFLQVQSVDEERLEKSELVKASCELLQEMALTDACSHLSGEPAEKLGPSERTVKASIRQSGSCGRSWFLVVNIENVSQKDITLQDLSLSLTSVRGPISGRSSTIKSLCTADKVKHLVAALSQMDLLDCSACPTIHILLNSKLHKANAGCKHTTFTAPDTSDDNGATYSIYKTWIGQIEMRNIVTSTSLDPSAVPLIFREVAPKNTFMIHEKHKEHHVELVDAVKGALNLKFRDETENFESLQPHGVHELVARSGSLWADATIVSTGKTYMVTIRAEDSKHLSVLMTCLAMVVEDKMELQMEVPCSEVMNMALDFLRAFKEEIEQKKSVLEGVKLQETEKFRSSVALECDKQLSTDRHFASFLARVSKTDCCCDGHSHPLRTDQWSS